MANAIDKITGITIGIRFSKLFRIADISGEIIDDVLNNPKSPFDTDFFPKLNETMSKEKTLINEYGEYLKITPSDIILSLRVDEKATFEQRKKFISENVFSYFDDLFDNYSIEGINRVGFLFYNTLKSGNKEKNVVSEITNNSIEDVNSFDFRFSHKKKTMEGILKSGVKDYVNIIYSFSKEKEGRLLFDFDFQKFFVPELDKLKEAKMGDIFSKSIDTFENDYQKWIIQYDAQDEEADREKEKEAGVEEKENEE